ncbi:CMKK2 protein [Thozetella sp. PMI_491]|nr:CMKK2 protein [Thozetella sp. PMI_491]
MNHQLSEAEASESKDALFLIREEIAIMKKLNHPNLVQLIEVLDDPEEDSLYMVLEMCKKGVIMKVGLDEAADPYPEEDVRCWFRDLILGIEYLHSQGVVHRDIKPDNLLLTEDDVLKVVDFGVSEMFEKPDDMRTAKSAGSPAFLPPELCVGRHGEVSGKAADIWSMGVSLYCLRYGRIPFERSGVLEMYEAIKTETPKLPADEDPVFADMIQRLMDKDPEQRIKMEELREHPWVTKQGQDPLLSPEENCSDLVEFPNDLEVNHAFTQKMSHLLCVMKAISKFKGLLRQDSTSSISRGRQEISSEHDNSSQTTASKVENERSTSEHAAAVLRERERFFATASSRGSWQSLPGEKGHAHDPTDVEPLFLGIGTGSMDEFSTPQPEPTEPVADIVSDSPTAVDFNVYDRAFEAEVERIKRSSSRRKGTGTLYHTKHLHGKDRYQSDESVTVRLQI